MAGFLATNDVLRVTYFGTLMGQRILNVFKLRVKTAPGGTDIFVQLNNIASKLADTVTGPALPLWVPLVGGAFSFDKVRVQRFWPDRTIFGEVLIAQNGTNANQPTLPNVAMSVEKRTHVAGRKGIGRVQIAGMPASEYTDGLWTTAAQTDAGTAFQFLKGDFTVTADGGVYRWCLFSGAPIPENDDIIDVQPKPEVRDMRRRTVGLGI
jgi:hypothetical protein